MVEGREYDLKVIITSDSCQAVAYILFKSKQNEVKHVKFLQSNK